ncbi:Hypothetical predicted protein [Pelobates cultripes]|uniref:Uncharacterized protein n=1 Tax=Pelobates cultripes TaxID=61616 RepID=A0AAD1R8V3_PELCU|nr:Hypothetical predicted protein [Pelobates cultripes]
MKHMVTAHNCAATLTNKLLHRSNRSRKNNLCVRGLPEIVGEADIETGLVICFQQSLPDIPDHLWGVLRARGPKNSPPRVVIMKWHYFKTKEAILKYSRTQAYTHNGMEVQLFQDVSPTTLLRRRE